MRAGARIHSAKGINFKLDQKLLQALNEEATFEHGEAGVQVPQKTKLRCMLPEDRIIFLAASITCIISGMSAGFASLILLFIIY